MLLVLRIILDGPVLLVKSAHVLVVVRVVVVVEGHDVGVARLLELLLLLLSQHHYVVAGGLAEERDLLEYDDLLDGDSLLRIPLLGSEARLR